MTSKARRRHLAELILLSPKVKILLRHGVGGLWVQTGLSQPNVSKSWQVSESFVPSPPTLLFFLHTVRPLQIHACLLAPYRLPSAVQLLSRALYCAWKSNPAVHVIPILARCSKLNRSSQLFDACGSDKDQRQQL